jgi:uncharacterized caspase-like protein
MSKDFPRLTMAHEFSRCFALVVGIANYQRVKRLPETVAKDARDIAALLTSKDYCAYPADQVKMLLDEEATAAKMRLALQWLAEATTEQDTVVVYFSGHGGRTDSHPNSTFLIPVDCDLQNMDQSAIESLELTTSLGAIRAQRLVVLLDACHSAGVGELKSLAPASGFHPGFDDKAFNSLLQGTGRVIMASSRATEASLILHGMENSLFTHFLLEALRGNAIGGDEQEVRVFNVFNYVSDNVTAIAASQHPPASQHPIFKAQNVENNFALAHVPNPVKLVAGEKPDVARPKRLSGPLKVDITERLVDRWQTLSLYFDIPASDQARFTKGDEPRAILQWLEQRGVLSQLRDAFNYLSWDDLLEVLDRPT